MFIFDYSEIYGMIHNFIKIYFILSKSIILTFFASVHKQLRKIADESFIFPIPITKTHIIPNILFMIIHTVHNMGPVSSLLKDIILSVLKQ